MKSGSNGLPEAPNRGLKRGVDVAVDALCVRFGEGAKHVLAVTDASFRIEPGELVCLLGPSGCGKSTILNVIAGLVPAKRGRVFIDGDVATTIDRRVGYMFQRDTLLPWTTAIGNVLLPMQVVGKPNRDRAKELLRIVQLEGFEQHWPHELSGGMRKRVQLARLLAQDPDVFLMDEPFGALDAQTRLIVQQQFLRIWESAPRTTAFVTHDLAEAIIMGDRVLIMSRRPGRIKAEYRVDFPRPREIWNLMGTSRYQELYKELWTSLEEEVESTMIASVGNKRDQGQ